MSAHEQPPRAAEALAREFSTTHWSVVLAAGQMDLPSAAEALEKLCRAYWYPLYAYARRLGNNAEDAQDLTQSFFARFLANNSISLADRSRGRFRTFLLNSFKNFTIDEWNKTQREKRGGGHVIISTEAEEAENRYQKEPSHTETPEKLYDRTWANSVLEHALAKLRAEYYQAEKAKVFDQLQCSLDGSCQKSYAEIAGELGMSEAAVKQQAHRMRRRYRALVLVEVATTLADPKDAENELRALLAALTR